MRLIIAAVIISLAAPPSVLAASLEVVRYLQGAAEESTYEVAIARVGHKGARLGLMFGRTLAASSMNRKTTVML